MRNYKWLKCFSFFIASVFISVSVNAQTGKETQKLIIT